MSKEKFFNKDLNAAIINSAKKGAVFGLGAGISIGLAAGAGAFGVGGIGGAAIGAVIGAGAGAGIGALLPIIEKLLKLLKHELQKAHAARGEPRIEGDNPVRFFQKFNDKKPAESVVFLEEDQNIVDL
ncbi:MAG: hypothetical protein M3R00_00850 [Pseudomonadota bacterium]|nr:hypothetical protein [Pseudomonadota bacterium]